ncbi:TetR/AcrR family transcriptional regulator [Streptomyces sp. NPDC060184]|uniref:TetR/AcrR family transcriptional regulator n=1 Tax=Streptomyces sp. NPDC060184 TaxID=3347064 RepID=UPI00365CD7CB
MSEGMSLRERKKLRTRHRLLTVATDLFLERGFDQVSVAEIAEAADVSKMTVFNYFGSKEDLICAPLEEHLDDVPRAVRERAPGESALAAVRRQFLEALDARDASVALSSAPVVLAVRRLIEETPSLLSRAHAYSIRTRDRLAEVLADEGEDAVEARIVAAQLIATRSALVREIRVRILAGADAEALAPEAVRLAERGFALLETGLGGFATRR